MKRVVLSVFILALAMITLSGQNRYEAITSSTKIQWNAKKVTGEHTGTIALKEGWIDWKKNEIVSGKFVVDMTTIQDSDLKDEKMKRTLEGHLKSDDFFGVEKNPVSTLEITGKSIFVNGAGIVKGNLTIKGITLPIEFNATALETKETITFTGKITVNRAKYDVRYGSGSFFSDLGDKLIYDDFVLDVTLVVEKKKTN
jgi:polyisoprenoid-binding protein YceI